MTTTLSAERYYMQGNGKIEIATELPQDAHTIFATETATRGGDRKIKLYRQADSDGSSEATLEAEVFPLYNIKLVSSSIACCAETVHGTFFGYCIKGRAYTSASSQPECLLSSFKEVLSALINPLDGKIDEPELHTQKLEHTTVTRFRWQVGSLNPSPTPLLNDYTRFVAGFAIPCK